MFERFTEPARAVVVLAQDEARALNHNYIGTEHLLLGLFREEEGIAASALRSLGVGLEEARGQVVRIVGFGDQAVVGNIPFTPRAKKVLELGLKESRALGKDYIGTEHLLLGLATESEGIATQILRSRGIDTDKIRQAVVEHLEREPPSAPWVRPPRGVPFLTVTESSDGGRARFFGLWVTRNAALLAASILFGVGLLVGWLIWG